MNVNLGIWDKLTKLAVFLLFILGVAGVALWYFPLIKKNERMRQELLKLEAKIKVEQERDRMLRASFESVRTNPKTIERLARTHLGYAKPGETVIRFEEPAVQR